MSRRDRGSAQQILAVTLAVVMLVSMGGMAFVGGASAQTGGTYDQVFDGSTDVSGDLNLADGQVRAVGPSGGSGASVNDDGSVALTGTGNDGQFVGVELTPDRIEELSDVSADPGTAPADFLDQAPAEFETGSDATTSAVFIEFAPQSNISQIEGDNTVSGSHDFIVVSTVPSTAGNEVDGLVDTDVSDGNNGLSTGEIVALSVGNDGANADSTLLASGDSYGTVFDALVGQSTSDLQNENVDDFQYVAGTFNDNSPTLEQVRLGDDVDSFPTGQTVHSEKITLVDAEDGSERFFSSIANAEDAADTDDSISLADGVYDDGVDLGVGGLTVEPDNASTDTPEVSGTVTYSADNVTVDGLSINTGAVTDDGSTVESPTLTNSTVDSDGTSPAVDFGDSTGATATDNDITAASEQVNTGDIGLDVSNGFATVSGNDIRDFQTQIAATSDSDLNALRADNAFANNSESQAAVAVNETGAVQGTAIFGSIDEADSEAATGGDSIEVVGGTYDHGSGAIDIATENVSLVDVEDAATISNEVSLNAGTTTDGAVSVDGFTINGNLVTDSSPDAVVVTDTDANDFNFGTIADVTVEDTSGADYTADGDTVSITGASGATYSVTAPDATLESVEADATQTSGVAITIDAGGSGNVSVANSTVTLDGDNNGIDIVTDSGETEESVTVLNNTVSPADDAPDAAPTAVSITNIDTALPDNDYSVVDNELTGLGDGTAVDVAERSGAAEQNQEQDLGALRVVNNEMRGATEFTGLVYNLPEATNAAIEGNVIVGADVAGGDNSVGVEFSEVLDFGSGGIFGSGDSLTFEDNVITGHAQLVADTGDSERTVLGSDYTAMYNSTKLNNSFGTIVTGPDNETYQDTFDITSDIYDGTDRTYLPGSVSEAADLVADSDEADSQTVTLEVSEIDTDVGGPTTYDDAAPVTFPDREAITITGETEGVTVATNFDIPDSDNENSHDISDLRIDAGSNTAIDVDSNNAQSEFDNLVVTAAGTGVDVTTNGNDVNVVNVTNSEFTVKDSGIVLNTANSDDRDGFVIDNVEINGTGIGTDESVGIDLSGVEKPGKDGLPVDLEVTDNDVTNFETLVAVEESPLTVDADDFLTNASSTDIEISNNTFDRAVTVSDGSTDLYGSVDLAASDAASDATVTVQGTVRGDTAPEYDHEGVVTVDTSGVTIDGEDDPTIADGIDVTQGGVAIQTLAVEANGSDRANTAAGSDGAVIDSNNGALSVESVTVTTDIDGSTLPIGVAATGGSLTVDDSTIGASSGTTGAGIVANQDVTLELTDSTLVGGVSGPGVDAADGTTPALTNTTITGFAGPGLSVTDDSLTITGGEISNNGAAGVTDDGVSAPATQYDINGTAILNNGGDGVALTDVGVALRDGANVTGNANGVVVSGAETVNVTDATVSANGNGVAVTDGNATVTQSTVTGNDAGVVFDLGDAGGSELTRTELAGNGDGLRVESGAAELTVTGNDFANENTDIVNNDADALDATLNFFGTDRGPEAAAGVDEDVVYDPFLTTDQTDSTVATITETTDFGHDIIVDGNSVTTIGFPAKPAAPAGTTPTLDKFLDDDLSGNVYGFDNEAEEFTRLDETAQENTEVDAFDAFVVENTQTAAETIAVTYADNRGAGDVVDSRYEFQKGLNFVAPAQAGTVEESLLVGQPTDQVIQPFELGGNLYGTDAAQVRDSFVSPDGTFADSYETGAGERIVHPHAGYLVDVNPDDITPGAGLFPAISTATAPATADTVAAQTDNAPVATNVNTGESYNNLQSAFADAEPGAQIQLGPGTALLDAAGARDELSVATSDLTVTGAGTAVTTVDGSLEFTGEDVVVEGFTVNGELTVTGAGNGFTSNNVNTVANSPGDLTLTSDVTSASISNADVDGELDIQAASSEVDDISISNSAANSVSVPDSENVTTEDVSTRTVEVSNETQLDNAAAGDAVTINGNDVQVGSQTTVVVTSNIPLLDTTSVTQPGLTITTDDATVTGGSDTDVFKVDADGVTIDSASVAVDGDASAVTLTDAVDSVTLTNTAFDLGATDAGDETAIDASSATSSVAATIEDNTFTATGTEGERFVNDPNDVLDLAAIQNENDFSANVVLVEGNSDFALTPTIQGGVNVASNTDGDTVSVSAGTYDESVTVDVEGLTLEGADGATPTVDGTDGVRDTISITANNVTVQSLDAVATGSGTPRAIVSTGDSVTIADNTVSHTDDAPEERRTGPLIAVAGGDNVTVDGNTATDGPIAYTGGDNNQVAFTNNAVEGDLVDEGFFAFSGTDPDITFTGNDFSAAETGQDADVKFDLSATVNGETDDAAIATSVIGNNTGVDDVQGNDGETRTE